MSDHRRLQRTLVRMQLDPVFAGRILAGDEAAARDTGLLPDDLGLLCALDPLALGADRDDARRRRTAGNASREHPLTLALLAAVAPAESPPEAFLGSPEMHAALAEDRPLVIAFGRFLARRFAGPDRPAVAALLALENELASARRACPPPDPASPPGDALALSPSARLVELPRGTFALASEVRVRLDEAPPRPAPDPPSLGPASETLLVVARPAPRRAGPREVSVEPVEGATLALLSAAQRPLDAAARAALARDLGASPQELEAFAVELVAEGILVCGAAAPPPGG